MKRYKKRKAGSGFMQLTYYRFPADMPIRDCYDA